MLIWWIDYGSWPTTNKQTDLLTLIPTENWKTHSNAYFFKSSLFFLETAKILLNHLWVQDIHKEEKEQGSKLPETLQLQQTNPLKIIPLTHGNTRGKRNKTPKPGKEQDLLKWKQQSPPQTKPQLTLPFVNKTAIFKSSLNFHIISY
jgi:hypothetical protein